MNIDQLSHISTFGLSKSKIKNTVQITAKTKNICAKSHCQTNSDFAKKNKVHQAIAQSPETFQEIQSAQFIVFVIHIIQKKIKRSAKI